MATYHMDVAALLNNIKTRLGEYPYGEHGHSIFKELLQPTFRRGWGRGD